MKQIKNLKISLLLILVIFILYFGWRREVDVKCSSLKSSRPSTRLLQTVDMLSTEFEFIEEHKNISLQNIVLGEEAIFAFGSISDKAKLFSLNPISGHVNWHTCASGLIALGTEYVFTSYNNDPRGAYVIAYDREAGTEVWQEKVDFLRSIKALTITPFGLLTKTANRSSERFYLLDLETGKQEASFRSEAERQNFWIENDSAVYQVAEHNKIIARGKTKWQTQVDYDSFFDIEPIELIVTNGVLVAYKKSATITQVAVLDKNNGEVIWQTSVTLESNIAVADGILYFVREHSELIAINLETGQRLGSVIFTPGVNEIPGRNTRVHVAAKGKQIVVYFSSSYQLFVFHFT